MPITNRDRFPDVDFLPDNQIKLVGSVGSTTLVLVGHEQGSDSLVVAKSYAADPTKEDLFAVPLYELMSHSQDAVNITDS
jgi:hypothetical protein